MLYTRLHLEAGSINLLCYYQPMPPYPLAHPDSDGGGPHGDPNRQTKGSSIMLGSVGTLREKAEEG